VPAVAGGDEHAVDVGALGQELANLGIHAAVAVAVALVDGLLDLLARRLLGIADRHELHVRFRQHPPQVTHSAAADADAAHHDALAGGHGAVAAQGGSGDDGRRREGRTGRGSRLEKPSPRQIRRR